MSMGRKPKGAPATNQAENMAILTRQKSGDGYFTDK